MNENPIETFQDLYLALKEVPQELREAISIGMNQEDLELGLVISDIKEHDHDEVLEALEQLPEYKEIEMYFANLLDAPGEVEDMLHDEKIDEALGDGGIITVTSGNDLKVWRP